MSENIVIPKQFYINYDSRPENYWNAKTLTWDKSVPVKLGFATYFENNVAFRKRKSTIDSWGSGDFTPDTFDNAPRTGFKFSKMVTHGGGWNDTSTYWRVVDPLGFELEISASNVARLFKYIDVVKGEIQGECVLGWDKGNGSKVVLLPANCELYEKAKVTTDRHYAPVKSLKDINIGDEVELKNGTKGKYFGKISYGYQDSSVYDEKGGAEVVYGMIKTGTTYVFETTMTYEGLGDRHTLYFMSTPKVVGVIPTTEKWNKPKAEKHLNELLAKTTVFRESASNGPARSIRFITYDTEKDVKFEYKTRMVSFDELKSLIRSKTNLDNLNKNHCATYGLKNFKSAGEEEFVVIAALKNLDMVLLNGMPKIEAEYHYDADAKYVMKPNPQQDFVFGKTEDCMLEGHKIIQTITAVDGIKLERNPNWLPRDRRPYGYNVWAPFVSTPSFKLSEASAFYMPMLYFKDYVINLTGR